MVESKLNELSERVKLISTKRLIGGLINKYSILNSEKYFGENGLENYLVFKSFSRYLNSKNWFTTVKNNFRRKYYTSIYNIQKFWLEMIYIYGKTKIKFKGICLKQDFVAFI